MRIPLLALLLVCSAVNAQVLVNGGDLAAIKSVVGDEIIAAVETTMAQRKAASGYNGGFLVLSNDGIHFLGDRRIENEKWFAAYDSVQRVQVERGLRFTHLALYMPDGPRYFNIRRRDVGAFAAAIEDRMP